MIGGPNTPTVAARGSATRHPPMSAGWTGWAAAGAMAAALPLLSDNSFHLHTGVMLFLNAIAAVGLLIIARVGQLSLCHAALVGIGAYGSAIATMRGGVPFLGGVALSVAFVGVLSALLGWLILRTRGVYFVLITFAFGQVASLMFLDLEPITGGAVGIPGVPSPVILGHVFQTAFDYYYLALAFLALTVVFAVRLLASPVGRAFDSIADNPRLAESSGIPTMSFQILAFTLGGMIAGLSGALSVHYLRFVAPGGYDTALTVGLIVMLVLGGRRSVAGVLLGAAFLTPLSDLLRETQQLQNIIYGAVVLVMLRFLPDGIVSLPARLRSLGDRLARRNRA